MKFLVLALLGYLGVVTHAHCGNTQPIVYGFEGATPFLFPPTLATGEFPDCLFDGGCITYETGNEISYDTYAANGNETTEKLTPGTVYTDSTNLTTFVQLCEELWILTDYIAQSSAEQGDYAYESRGLCFGGAFLYEANLNSARAAFIIDTCHGSEDTVDERLARLAEDVETTLALAEDRARQQTFNTTAPTLADHLQEAEDLYEEGDGGICDPNAGDCTNNQDVCLQLKECYIFQFNESLFKGFDTLVPEGVDVDTIPTVDDIVSDSFVYSECFNVTYSDLFSKKEGICEEITVNGCSPYSISNGSGKCGPSDSTDASEPVCPVAFEGFFDSFAPDYPNTTKYPSYGVAVASIEDLFLCSADDGIDYTDRTSADAVGITLIVKIALQSLQIAFEILKDSLPHWVLYIWKIIPYIANGITINIVDTILEQTALHDGLVDGAEMEGIYENS
jgi:hypothetical protein